MPNIGWTLQANQNISPEIKAIDDALKQMGSGSSAAFQQFFNNFGNAENVVNKLSVSIKNVENASRQATTGGLGSFINSITHIAGGVTLSNIIQDITSKIVGLTTELIKQPAEFEGYANAYVRIFHSVEIAKQHMDDVLNFAQQAPQSVSQVLKLDQQLSLITEHTGNLKARVGEDFNGIRQSIVDASSGMNKDLETVGNAFIRVFQGATGFGINALQRMGLISKQELAAQGIEFNKSGSKILSDSDKVTAALLQIWNTKFGGMASVQSNTFNGILSNIKDWGVKAALYLGGDFFAEAKTHLKEFWDFIRQPEVLDTLKEWGTNLGKLGHLAWEGFSLAAQGAQYFLAFIRPITDAIGQLLAMLPSGTQSLNGIFDPSAATAGQQALDIQDGYNAALDDANVSSDELKDKLKGIQREHQNINAQLDDQIQKLRAQETELDRIYEKKKSDRDIEELKKQIQRDTALSKDIYNPEGKAAALRLVDEQTRLADMQEAAAHTQQKNAIQDKISAIEAEKRAGDNNARAQENAINDQIDALQKQSSFLQNALKDFTDGQQKYKQASDDSSQSTQNNISLIDQLSQALENLHIKSTGFATAWNEEVLPALNDAPSKWDEFTTYVNKAAKSLGIDKGLAFVLIDAQRTLHDFFDLVDVMGPVMLDDFGTTISLIIGFVETLIGNIVNIIKVAANIPAALAAGDSNKLFEGLLQLPDFGKQVQDAIGHTFGSNNKGQQGLDELNKRHAANMQQEFRDLAGNDTLFPGATDTQNSMNQSEFPSAANDARQIAANSGGGQTVTVITQTQNECPSCKKKTFLNNVYEQRAAISDAVGGYVKSTTGH
jgi:hypothetical protein